MASTRSPALTEVGGELLAHLELADVVEPQLDQAAGPGSTPAAVVVTLLGLVERGGAPDAPGHLEGRVARRARAS